MRRLGCLRWLRRLRYLRCLQRLRWLRRLQCLRWLRWLRCLWGLRWLRWFRRFRRLRWFRRLRIAAEVEHAQEAFKRSPAALRPSRIAFMGALLGFTGTHFPLALALLGLLSANVLFVRTHPLGIE